MFENESLKSRADLQKLLSSNILLKHKSLEIDKNVVPQSLWALIPYAETWGFQDSDVRMRLVDEAPLEALRNLRWAVKQNEQELEKWLTGSAADERPPSGSYVSFTAMLMAADYAEHRL